MTLVCRAQQRQSIQEIRGFELFNLPFFLTLGTHKSNWFVTLNLALKEKGMRFKLHSLGVLSKTLINLVVSPFSVILNLLFFVSFLMSLDYSKQASEHFSQFKNTPNYHSTTFLLFSKNNIFSSFHFSL